jgi:hypothetical protein
MRISTKGAHITCYRDDRAKFELADGRTFDADKIHLRTTGGEVIASPVTCDLFALPPTVELVAREYAELYDLAKAAKKVRRPLAAVESTCRRYRIGRRFGNERLLNDAEVAKLTEKLAIAGKKAKPKTGAKRATRKTAGKRVSKARR